MNISQWISNYAIAWETGDDVLIAELFTSDASYRSNIFGKPHVGTGAIQAYWKRGAGSQRNVKVQMGSPIQTELVVVVEWWTTMTDPVKGDITLPGCLLLKFAEDGRCSDLWEYWMVEDGFSPPPAGWGQWNAMSQSL